MLMWSTPSLIRDWFQRPQTEILSGLVVAFAMIPEAIAFSGIAGVEPQVGLFGAFCLSVTISFVGGRQGMITSATGSTALLMTGLISNSETRSAGLSYLLIAGLLAGVLQILWGFLGLAYQMRFVPQAVLSGFVNALALLIAQAQFPQLGLVSQSSGKATNYVLGLAPSGDQLPIVWGLVLLGLLIIYVLPRLTRFIPPQLVAIIVLTVVSIIFQLEVPTVGDLGKLPSGLPQFANPFGALANGRAPFDLNTLGLVLPTALAISFVGLLETFLTQDILDDLTDTTSNKNIEARGQGIANIVSSFFGGMAGCALVGQSVMNTENGGRTRLSTMSSGISLLLLILLARQWLELIPMAALVSIMLSIAVSTADLQGIRHIHRIPRSDTAVMLMTFSVTMLTTPHNLALGVLAGVSLAALLFSRKVAKVIQVSSVDISSSERRYEVSGQLFFVSRVYFQQGFDLHNHLRKITIDMSHAHIWDQSGVNALDQVVRKLSQRGSLVEVTGLNNESLNLFERIGKTGKVLSN
ncbi:SulP family inorganic anion transporter [cyanobiont of Ornithocercus magnificus]|nr:SulP family inorganic anion transporter [cyanobiont of Ornithocercus magnificus]